MQPAQDICCLQISTGAKISRGEGNSPVSAGDSTVKFAAERVHSIRAGQNESRASARNMNQPLLAASGFPVFRAW